MKTTIINSKKTIKGHQRAWIEAGQGAAVLLLHGFPDVPQGFLPQIEALAAAGFRAIAPYSRGNAPSFVPDDDDHSPLALATDVVDFLDGLGIEKAAAVIGHDWGAVTGYAFASLAPHRLDRLITLSVPHARFSKPTLTWGSLVLAMQTPRITARLSAIKDGVLVDQMFRRVSPHWAFSAADTADAKRILTDSETLQNVTGVYRALRKWPIKRDESFKLLMKRISVPTLTLAGKDDTAMPITDFRKMAGAFQASFELIELENVGHFPHREVPAQVNAALLSYLGATKASSPSRKPKP